MPPAAGDVPGPVTTPTATSAAAAADVGRSVFRPGSQEELAPSGAKARFAANVAALRVLRRLQTEHRPATDEEQRTLARWGSWGAAGLWPVFDPARADWDRERALLLELLSAEEFAAARRTSLNAHFTDPALAGPVWAALVGLGFTGGRVLEPGCGAGTFLGLAPASAELTGVELDPVTAGIAAALYPQATIRAESFARTVFPAGHFDAAVGNVPFSEVVLHDPRYNSGRLSLHNHFIVKSVELVRPGGLVAVLTSRYTMDGQNPAARRAIAERADLVAAVRLPNGAHRRAAGTDACTDLLILRRRAPGEGPGRPFDETVLVEVPTVDGRFEQARLNTYWAAHPERVVGRTVLGVGLHGVFGVQVEQLPGSPVAEQFAAALAQVVREASAAGFGFTERTAPEPVPAAGWVPAMAGEIDGQLVRRDDGRSFAVVRDGQRQLLRLPRGASPAEVSALLGLRDQARALVAAEAADLDDDPELDRRRAQLAAGWRSYVQGYGPINRSTRRRTGRTDPDTGEETYARLTPPAVRLMMADPYGALVLALEVFDGQTQTATPAGILSERQIVPRQPVQGVDTAADGLAVVLDTHGRVDVEEIARLMGVTRGEALAGLAETVFQVPGTEAWVTRAEYLSGDVRDKLDRAQAAALAEPGRWDAQVAALASVLPRDVPAGDITTGLGAIWIADADYTAFLREILDDPRATVRRLVGSSWEVEGSRWGAKATAEWGTARLPAPVLLQHVLGQEPVAVYDTLPDKTRQLNPLETAAALEKAEALQRRFSEWIWTDPERTVRLVAEYNRRFNSLVLRDYTVEGGLLTFPGLSQAFRPRPHQRAAVARMIQEPSVGLFHAVGAGKTAEMVLGVMELKRLGLIKKAAVVVPNHMLNQFAADWLQLYPQAKVLAAGADDLAEDHRRRFIAKIATHDWDAVILTRTAFQRIGLSPAHEHAFEERQLADLHQQLARLATGGESRALRQLERGLAAREEKHRRARDVPHDPGLTWEHTGFDYLVVDELHDYKNLQTVSSVRDVAIDGSKRALDLFAKIDYHRHTLGQERVLVGATATPIANSITEMFVMQRYLDPAGLDRVGITDVDSWLATFAETVTAPELSVAGGERLVWKSRVAKFHNVPELLGMFHAFGDVKTAEDLQLPCPQLARRPADGERAPNAVIVPRSPDLADYVTELGRRADRVAAGGVDPTRDNLLKIAVDGRLAALDLRLVRPGTVPAGPSKITAAADLLHRVWAQTRHYRYLDATGQLSPHPGALQVVFCDLSTPGPGWHVYGALKQALVDRGLPADRIRFIHEARNDHEKAHLLEACRNGHVAVLIGSTAKMGTGVNLQHRCVHLLHLDAPWRPADLTQRDGRGLRQLNQHTEVMVTTVVTDGSFDAFMWSALERKGRFIDQVMTGRHVERSVEDLGQATLNYAEIKAAISGNPLLIEHAEAERDVRRLTRLARSHDQTEWALQATIRSGRHELDQITADLPQLERLAGLVQPTKGDDFHMIVIRPQRGRGFDPTTFSDREYFERAAAAHAIADALGARPEGRLGTLGRLHLHYETVPGREWGSRSYRFTLPDAPGVVATTDWIGRGAPNADLGTVARLEHLVASLPQRITELRLRQTKVERTLQQAEQVAGRPFPHTAALADARTRLDQVATLIAASKNQPPTDPDPGHDPVPPPPDAVVNHTPQIPAAPTHRTRADALEHQHAALTPPLSRTHAPLR